MTDLISCDVFRESGENIKIWVGSDSDVWDHFAKITQIPERLVSLGPQPNFYYKYLVPQMVARYRLSSSGPLAWDLPGSWMVGHS